MSTTTASTTASSPATSSPARAILVDVSRPLLASSAIAQPALEKMTSFHADVVREVADAVSRHDVVVVGMAQNPHVKNVRKALTEANIAFEYLEYGSYFSEWKKRLAIKMWSGWPTFPQVFVKGTLLGGEDLVKAALADGSLKKRLG
jgi:glutaredoxin-related protein